MLRFRILEKLYGTDITSRLRFLNETQWWKAERLEELQNRRLRMMIKHAYENVPYYRRIFKERNLDPNDIKEKDDLRKLPILTKDDIRKNLTDLIARNVPKSKFIEAHSSGSTGEPLKYFLDKRAYSMGWAQTFRCWGWAGYRIGDKYVKISLNPRKGIKKRIQDALMRCTYIYSSGIREDNVEVYLKKMIGSKIIRSYASSAYMLAKLGESKDVPKPNAFATTGEILYDRWRKKIEEVFETMVLDGYGGESTPIAFQCPSGAYHVCAESVILEVLRGDEPTDGMGEVVITNLDNWAMPLIRYKLNDIVTPSNGCDCGRDLPTLKSIEGRDTDIVITPNGFLVVHFFTILFEYIEGVDAFQVVQEEMDRLTIKIVKNNKFKEKDKEYIKNKIREHAGDINIEFEFLEKIPSKNKRRFVISKVPIERLWYG